MLQQPSARLFNHDWVGMLSGGTHRADELTNGSTASLFRPEAAEKQEARTQTEVGRGEDIKNINRRERSGGRESNSAY